MIFYPYRSLQFHILCIMLCAYVIHCLTKLLWIFKLKMLSHSKSIDLRSLFKVSRTKKKHNLIPLSRVTSTFISSIIALAKFPKYSLSLFAIARVIAPAGMLKSPSCSLVLESPICPPEYVSHSHSPNS